MFHAIADRSRGRLVLLTAIFLTSFFCDITAKVATAGARNDAQPPNVLMIISDDQAATDYSFMGHPVIQTPHLDRLASQSALFRSGYTPTPLCRPSLMSMITGRYAHQHGVTGNDPRQRPGLSPEQYAALREQLISII